MRLFGWLKQNTKIVNRRHKLDSTDGTSLALSQTLRRLKTFAHKLDEEVSRVVQPGFVDGYLRNGLIVGLDAAQHDFIYDKSLSHAASQEMTRLESNHQRLHLILNTFKKDGRLLLERARLGVNGLLKPGARVDSVALAEVKSQVNTCLGDIITHKEKVKAEIATLTLKHHDAELAYAFLAAMDEAVNELKTDLDAYISLLQASISA